MGANLNCDKCNETFKTTFNLNRHKQYSCPYNLNKTKRQDNLNRKKSSLVNKCAINGVQVLNKDTIDNKTESANMELVVHSQDLVPNKGNEDSSLVKMMLGIQDRLERMESKLNPSVIKPQCFNIEKIQIYMTDPIDFVEVLTKRMGTRKQAIDYIRSNK